MVILYIGSLKFIAKHCDKSVVVDGSILSDPLFTKGLSVKFVQKYNKCLSYIHIPDILTFHLVYNAL